MYITNYTKQKSLVIVFLGLLEMDSDVDKVDLKTPCSCNCTSLHASSLYTISHVCRIKFACFPPSNYDNDKNITPPQHIESTKSRKSMWLQKKLFSRLRGPP